ncbi:ADP-ribose pyrophosphatase, mitochondrial [Engraulis encrasicolus]|uniref:ADP-ribose pyrophosphatase, mitochondrial n=1 Tax=Engraulis encrasicolus TaxID=184585 RepID=UPI002FD4AFAF
MVRALSRWVRSVHVAFTLFGLPYPVSSAGSCLVKSAISSSSSVCSSGLGRSSTIMASVLHIKARSPVYPGSTTNRLPVADALVSWQQAWNDYQPPTYTAPTVQAQPVWADPDIGSFSPSFNSLDGKVDRHSHEGEYTVQDNRPLNPRGRTGVSGRGLLGRWGPNHAADPIVTRWKTDEAGKRVSHPDSSLPVLQFVAIKRRDCGEWAIPGGMVDPGECVSATLMREFSEEALNSLVTPNKAELHTRITQLFDSPGLQVYKGYVDDPRNTDNAWMETIAVNFHDEAGDSVSELPLEAGDDAGQVTWMDLDSAQPLYASHAHFLETVAKKRQAHW